ETKPPITERLKLSDDQIQRVRTIADEGTAEINKAASFPIVLDSKEKTPSADAIRALVESPEFDASKKKARQAGRDAWAAVMARIEEILTVEQRASYHKQLGAPFDLSTMEVMPPQQARQMEINMVSRAVGAPGGGGGGQRADPDFNTKVAHPA